MALPFWPLPARAEKICGDDGICIEINQPARRIIALYGAFNEMLIELGAEQSLAGRTVADAGLPGLARLPVVGTHMRPNTELIVSLKPDLVLQMSGRKEASLQTENLRMFAIPVLTFELSSFQQLFACLHTLGALTGCQTQAANMLEDWQKRLAAIKSDAPARKPTVYYEVREPNLLAAGQKSLVNDIITVAGGENIIKTPKKLVRFNEEALLLANPEICLVQKGPMSPQPTPLAERPNLKNLACVRSGQVFVVAEQVFSRPGPGSITAAEYMAQIIQGNRP